MPKTFDMHYRFGISTLAGYLFFLFDSFRVDTWVFPDPSNLFVKAEGATMSSLPGKISMSSNLCVSFLLI